MLLGFFDWCCLIPFELACPPIKEEVRMLWIELYMS